MWYLLSFARWCQYRATNLCNYGKKYTNDVNNKGNSIIFVLKREKICYLVTIATNIYEDKHDKVGVVSQMVRCQTILIDPTNICFDYEESLCNTSFHTILV